MPQTPSKKLKPFMSYIDEDKHKALKKFSDRAGIPMSQLIREAIDMRISPESQYVEGFNAGMKTCIDTINNMQAAQMRFPSGKSFAELFTEELANQRMAANEAPR